MNCTKEKNIILIENDVDRIWWDLADVNGYPKKADANNSIKEKGLNKICTTYYVEEKSCWAIVKPKYW